MVVIPGPPVALGVAVWLVSAALPDQAEHRPNPPLLLRAVLARHPVGLEGVR
jgi:hypothetical protein